MARHLSAAKRKSIVARKMPQDERAQRFANSIKSSPELRLLQGPNPRIYRNEFFNGEILGASKIRFYRFEGVLIKDGMMVSDVPERWPLIDQLQELLDKLKYLQSRGQKGKPVQRRIEQLAVQI